ncbi:Expansin-like B1 [Gossypium arboreum]|uniref:Expansin-like B1 n=1 Tax=Gossypium arboreum TaxID=29729 RepID=A0A0B0MA62_GOSAR|nr:Expansin-like B1 [Gossypium arboreum]
MSLGFIGSTRMELAVVLAIRCTTNPQICTKKGVNVVVTDYGQGDNTDFILSHHAYEVMARPGTADRLFAYGVVGVEYQRVPCQYVGHKIQVKVHEYSRNPDYLAIIMLYQAGKSDILSVDIWQQGKWVEMRRSFGAVFDMPNPPLGAISLRFKVHDNAGIKWPKAVIPRNWKAGVAYDTDIQLQ